MWKYYSLVFKRAFTKSIGPVDIWMGLAGAAVGVIDHFWPAGQLVNSLAWQVPVWTFVVVMAARLLLAPYWLAKEDADRLAELETKLNRPDHKAQLEKFYVEAGELLENVPNPMSMIGNYKGRVAEVDNFTERVSTWLATNMGPASRSRFLDLGSEGHEGDAAEWKIKLRRKNLARLIESGSWESVSQ